MFFFPFPQVILLIGKGKKRTRNQQNNSEKGRKELGINKITRKSEEKN
jgi:hypothetical protein